MNIINKSILTETKKVLSIYLIVLLLLGRFTPLFVLAEEPGETDQTETQQAEPAVSTESTSDPTTESSPEPSTEPEANTDSLSSPSPAASPEPGVEIDDEAEVTDDVNSTAISGENLIEEPTPSPSPSPICSVLSEENQDQCDMESEEQVIEGAETNDEPEIITETTPGESPSPTPEASPTVIETGDAVSIVETENSVNSTEVNSQVLHQTLNIFVSGSIDLTTTPLAIADNIFNQANNNNPIVNVSVIDNENFAYLSNDIVSFANTGENEIEGGQEAIISTGDACSIVSLLNKVNTTIIDSVIHIVTINIFGSVKGNIILPEFSSEEDCCGEVIHIKDKAVVENNVDSMAISGQNSITSGEEASINTGSANSVVNLVNIVNTSLIGVTFHRLFINNFGEWNGEFLGWDGLSSSNSEGNLSFDSINSGNNGDCSTCADYVLVGNRAYVINNISSIANSGGNSIDGGEATINTGNAYSAISIINLINSSIVDSFGFLGFFNIFGLLEGNIGGASLFASSSEPEPEVENTSEQDSGPSIREEGGVLEVYQDNNVGTHVLPGDTITFFITVKNTGTGKVYDTELSINLIKDGVDMGGGIFELGDIESGGGVKLTTGLVLSEEAEPGNYIAHTEATGYVGPDDILISAYADKPFIIGGGFFSLLPGVAEEAKAAEPEEGVLGVMVENKGLTLNQRLLLLLFGSLTVLLTAEAIRRRKKLALAWSLRRNIISSKTSSLHSLVMRLSSFLS